MFLNFLKNDKVPQLLVGIAAGLYPFFHYYSSNLDLADSWFQLFFLITVCFVVPITLVLVSKYIFNLSFLQKFQKYRLAAINFVCFSGLLSMLIFLSNKKVFVLVIVIAALFSLLLNKYLKKIVLLQIIIAVMSLFTLIPKLFFAFNYNNSWTQITPKLENITLNNKPNIYVIQPDGYTDFEVMKKAPYNYSDTKFEDYLIENDFINYKNFRSNYYSTLTSNASMFAMKHHYYKNTYSGNLKTFGAQEVIVGNDNNVLKILKNNDYKTHLVTDNSFFTVNRKTALFDHSNVEGKTEKIYDSGGIHSVDIVTDFRNLVKNQSASSNFYFIEKTLPSHIAYTQASSQGIEKERENYFSRLKSANLWLQELISIINKNDNNALIVIVADHGGYVGLKSVKEVETRQLTAIETKSTFSSLLSIKWPQNNEPKGFNCKTNVNLFLYIFSYLADDKNILNDLEVDNSYLPLYDGSNAAYFQVLDENYKAYYVPIE